MNKSQNSPRVRRRVSQRHGERFGQNASNASTSNSTKIQVGRQIVGTVDGDVFIKRVKGSLHFLRVPPSIAFDINSLIQAEKAGAKTIRIIDSETDEVYQTLISTVRTKGFEIDRGHGQQIALHLDFWNRGNGPIARQLELWGENEYI